MCTAIQSLEKKYVYVIQMFRWRLTANKSCNEDYNKSFGM